MHPRSRNLLLTTTALLALSRVVGLKAGLVLARKIDQNCGKELSCYTEPLVRFWLANGESTDVDAESDDLPFGAVPPWLDCWQKKRRSLGR